MNFWTENKLVPAGVFSARLPALSIAFNAQLIDLGLTDPGYIEDPETSEAAEPKIALHGELA
jgi:hypothetical protein